MAKPVKKTRPPTPSRPAPAPASTKKVRKGPAEKGKPVKRARQPKRPMPIPASASSKKVRTAPVLFTGKRILAAGVKPPFGHEKGTYKDPGIVIENGHEPRLPKSVPCDGSLVICSTSAVLVADCTGFSGPNDGDNGMVTRALKNAQDAADKIVCAGDCVRHVDEIWRAWDCSLDPNQPAPTNKLAAAAVELEISCRTEP